MEVEKHKVLYDPTNKYYKDLSSKEKAWVEVASAVSSDGKLSISYLTVISSIEKSGHHSLYF